MDVAMNLGGVGGGVGGVGGVGKSGEGVGPTAKLTVGGIQPGVILHDTYCVRQQIAEGGMAVLYLATHERLPGLFVVKTPHPHLSHDPQMAARLRQEAEALATLDHPNIVRAIDFNETATGTPYLVMEYLDGRDLNSILRARRLGAWEVAAIVRQIAGALASAHARDIVHRDLKPENILVVPGPREGEDILKVIDFGVSKVERAPRVQSGVGLIGTPHYMAPEQAQGGQGRVDGRTDQFALAVMTYEMLARTPPFGNGDPVSILYRVVHEEAPPLVLTDEAGNSWTPYSVQETLARAMSKDPSARFASTSEFAEALAVAISADFGGGPAPLRLFQRPEAERATHLPRATVRPRLTPGSVPIPGSRSAVTSPHRVSSVALRPARRRAPAFLMAAAAAAIGLFFFRTEVQRALPPTARTQLDTLVGHVAVAARMVPSLSWGGQATAAPLPAHATATATAIQAAP